MKRINLLSKTKQTELFFEDLYRGVVTLVVLGTFVLLAGVVIQIAVWVYLQQKEASVIAEAAAIQQQIDESENAQLKAKVKEINALMSDFDRLATQTPQWSRVLKAFAQLVPNGVKITNFSADAATGTIEISGYSPSRELVIELYNNINGDKEHFKEINYPLENVAKPTNIIFNYTFTVQDGVLVPKLAQ
jgi:Tfp pilus assembly protein PilN